MFSLSFGFRLSLGEGDQGTGQLPEVWRVTSDAANPDAAFLVMTFLTW
jgi:hypothetical protein